MVVLLYTVHWAGLIAPLVSTISIILSFSKTGQPRFTWENGCWNGESKRERVIPLVLLQLTCWRTEVAVGRRSVIIRLPVQAICLHITASTYSRRSSLVWYHEGWLQFLVPVFSAALPLRLFPTLVLFSPWTRLVYIRCVSSQYEMFRGLPCSTDSLYLFC